MFPENLIRRRRTRQPWDEVLPTGETVAEAVQRLNGVGVDEAVQDAGLMPQRPVALNDPPVIPTASRVMTPPWNPNTDEPLTRRRVVGPQVSTTLTPEMADQSVVVRRPNVVPTGNVIEPELDTTLERPRRTQPRDMVADLSSYRRDVEQNPPKLSRGRAILAGLLQGLAMGGQSGLGGMLGGAATGAAIGAASPNTISRMRNQGKLAEIDQDIARETKLQDATLDNAYRRAQIDALQRKPAQQQSTALNRQQGVLLRQLSLQGKYKRGENPALDAQIEAAGLELSDFDKAKGQKPSWRSGDGYIWTEDEAGKPTPVLNPNTGEPMKSEANISRQEADIRRTEAKTEAGIKEDRQRGAQAQTKITQLAGLLREGKMAAAAELEQEIRANYGDLDAVEEAIEEAKKRNKYVPLDFPRMGK